MIYDIVHNGRGYSQMTAEELAAAGVPQSVIDQAVANRRRAAIKAECARRIYAVASAAAQQNMAAAVVLIAAKPSSACTQDDMDTLTAFEAACSWVHAMRSAVGGLAADASADYATDDAWPAVPGTVIELAAQF